MIPQHPEVDAQKPRGLSQNANDALSYLRQRGASFFADLVRGTGKLKSEMETALWELVTAGMIPADGFDNILALSDPKRPSGQGRGHNSRPHSAALRTGRNGRRVVFEWIYGRTIRAAHGRGVFAGHAQG